MCVQNKQKAAFWFIKLLLKYKKCVFKTSGGLLFSLLSYFFNTKNMCSKQAENCFLVYSATFVIQKHVCSNQAGGCFLGYSVTFAIRKMYVQNKREAAF